MSAKIPGQGCTCALCKQPHDIPQQAVIPDTPEHVVWLVDQELKRQESDNRFRATRPAIRIVNPDGIRKPT
jgi:hypothetical protein